jgi:hypothetical protein
MQPLQSLKDQLSQIVQKGQQQLGQFKEQLQTAASAEVLRARNSNSGAEVQGTRLGPAPVNAETKTHRIKQELNASRINIHGLRRLAFHGVPDAEPALRATVWKVRMGHSVHACMVGAMSRPCMWNTPTRWFGLVGAGPVQHAVLGRALLSPGIPQHGVMFSGPGL